MSNDDLSPEDEAILKRAMGRFRTRLALSRMGMKFQPHPVSDEEYQRALARPAYCKCSFTDDDGTVQPGEPCPIHRFACPACHAPVSASGEYCSDRCFDFAAGRRERE